MKILVCIDTSPLSEVVATEAGKLAARTGAVLDLVHVAHAQPLPDVDHLVAPEDMEYRIDHLEALGARLRADGKTVTTHSHLTRGPIHTYIVEEATRRGADLLVIGSHNRGRTFELFVGSVTQGVIAAARVPVVVVNGLVS